MISKELLSEVLNKNVTEVYLHKKHGLKYKTYIKREDGWESESDVPVPNIHELAFKCKEWALEKGFDIIVVEIDGKYCLLTPDCWQQNKLKQDMSFVVSETFKPQDTEPEAIFKACEWILKESNK